MTRQAARLLRLPRWRIDRSAAETALLGASGATLHKDNDRMAGRPVQLGTLPSLPPPCQQPLGISWDSPVFHRLLSCCETRHRIPTHKRPHADTRSFSRLPPPVTQRPALAHTSISSVHCAARAAFALLCDTSALPPPPSPLCLSPPSLLMLCFQAGSDGTAPCHEPR